MPWSSSTAGEAVGFTTWYGGPEGERQGAVKLATGETHPADVVVFATGFERCYYYLPKKDLEALGQTCEGIPLYRDCLPPQVQVNTPK
jgi:hypothetical protein